MSDNQQNTADTIKQTQGWLIYFYVYPIMLWLFAIAVAVRCFIYFLHIYNPTLSFMPYYSRITEFFICIMYLAVAVGWWYAKQFLLKKYNLTESWESYRKEIEEPQLQDRDRWGGKTHANKVVFWGVTGFLVLCTIFIFSAII